MSNNAERERIALAAPAMPKINIQIQRDAQAERAIEHMCMTAATAQTSLRHGDQLERVRCYILDVQKWAALALEDLVDDGTRRIAQTFAGGKTRTE